jgi:hypothetical protein
LFENVQVVYSLSANSKINFKTFGISSACGQYFRMSTLLKMPGKASLENLTLLECTQLPPVAKGNFLASSHLACHTWYGKVVLLQK